MLELSIENPDQPEVCALLDASGALMASLYPAHSNHLLALDALRAPNVVFIVARENGRAVGCGAVVQANGWAEVKRMFVSPASRGRGIGRQLLRKLETIAVTRGCERLRLETGVSQPEALALYRSAGFVEIEPFGEYRPDPLSLFMEKALGG